MCSPLISVLFVLMRVDISLFSSGILEFPLPNIHSPGMLIKIIAPEFLQSDFLVVVRLRYWFVSV